MADADNAKYAIIEDSGTQIRVRQGDRLTLDLRQETPEAESTITLDRVLLVGSGDGSPTVGAPYIDGASVSASVVNPDFKGEKVRTIKYKRRKGYKRTKGHRQRHMLVEVTAINA